MTKPRVLVADDGPTPHGQGLGQQDGQYDPDGWSVPSDNAELAEDVDIDEDVSAAELTGEAQLPGSELDPLNLLDVTSPRIYFPEASNPTPLDLAPIHLAEPAEPAEPRKISDIRRHAAAMPAQAEPTFPQQAEPTQHAVAAPVAPAPEDADAAADVVLRGSLAAIPLLDVFSMLARQQQTGVLIASAEDRRIEVIFQAGRIAQATATGLPDLRLGRFVSELHTISQDEVDQLAGQRPPQRSNGRPSLLGLLLCEVGYLSADELRQSLSQQSTELVYETLLWQEGRFVFTRSAPPAAAVNRHLGGALDLDVDALLLEGVRRIRDGYLVQGELDAGALGALYVRSDEGNGSGSSKIERLGLTRDEARVLDLCTGQSGLADIAREARLPPVQTARILRRLQIVRLVRRRLPAAAA